MAVPGLKTFLRGDLDRQQVGAFVPPAPDDLHPYSGPVAAITFDDTWLNICTDDHEGNAMLNIEVLPKLITALQRIKKARAAAARKAANPEETP